MNLFHPLSPAFGRVIEASLQGAVLIVLVLIIQRIFRARLGPGWAFALWFLVLLRLSMPSLPVSSWSWQRLAWGWESRAGIRGGGGQPAVVVNSTGVVPPAAGFPIPDSEPASAANGFAWNVVSPVDSKPVTGSGAGAENVWTGRLGLAWILVTLGLLARRWLSGWLFGRRLRRWPALDDAQLSALANHCREQLGIRRSIGIRVASEIESPGLAGVFRPVILLPRRLIKELDATEWRHIFLHEFAHVKRMDPVWNGWLTLLTCVHWFNPLVWYAARRMRADRELACDALVVADANPDDRRSYGHTLLKLATFPQTTALQSPMVGILEDGGPLKARLQSLAVRRGFWLYPILGFALILLLGASALTRLPGESGRDDLEPLDMAAQRDYPTANVELGAAQKNVDLAGMWGQIPKGRQSILGVPFNVTGIIRLAGFEAQRDERYFRPLVEGIPVGRPFGRLYLLHSTYYAAPAGTIIARVKLNYADGTSAELPVRYGNHTLNYWSQRYESPVNLSDPESRVAWTGEGSMLAQYGNSLRLCVSSLGNPSPTKPVHSIDLISGMQAASEVVVGLSVGGEHLPDEWQNTPKTMKPEANWTGHLRFQAVDGENGQPLDNVILHWEGAEEDAHFRLGPFATGADGWAEMTYPGGHLKSLALWVNADGYVPKFVQWTTKRDGAIPEQYVYRAERAARISGRVEDEQGNPVGGAMVRIEGPRPNFDGDTNEFLMLTKVYAISDSQGNWAATVIPKGFPAQKVRLRVQHAAFIAEVRHQLTADEAEGAEIRIRMTGGHVLVGSVLDAQGRPVAGASIRVKRLGFGEGLPGARTDAAGGFALSLPDSPEATAILCQATGFAPAMRMLGTQRPPGPLEPVILQPGRTVDIDVRDEQEQPVEAAMIEAVVGAFALENAAFTRSDGHARWSQAPASGIVFHVHRSGFASGYAVDAGDSTGITVHLKRAREISGSVTDAVTGQPIEHFQIWRGRPAGLESDKIGWGFAPIAVGSRGKFRITVDDQAGSDWGYQIRAQGYAPSDTFPAGKLDNHTDPIKLTAENGGTQTVPRP